MCRKKLSGLFISAGLLIVFVLWTAAIRRLDVQPIGPLDSAVGFAAVNGSFHSLTGVHMGLYVVTDWLGLVPVGVAGGFAALGLIQWIRRRSLLRVDGSLLLLGALYLAVIAAYLFFEQFIVNYRPVLIDQRLEPSYPSSTTLLTATVMPTAILQLRRRIRSCRLRRCCTLAMAAFSGLMIIARLVSGVHWLTDVVGGLLLSSGLVMLYRWGCSLLQG